MTVIARWTLALLLLAWPAAAQEQKLLHVFNWSDYISEEAIEDFEKATGIKVVYDTFDSNEVLEAKLMAGKSGYDIVVPTASFMQRQIGAGLFRKVDKAKLPNLNNLDKSLMRIVANHDPGNAYGVPDLWGTTGIGYNIDTIKARLPKKGDQILCVSIVFTVSQHFNRSLADHPMAHPLTTSFPTQPLSCSSTKRTTSHSWSCRR